LRTVGSWRKPRTRPSARRVPAAAHLAANRVIARMMAAIVRLTASWLPRSVNLAMTAASSAMAFWPASTAWVTCVSSAVGIERGLTPQSRFGTPVIRISPLSWRTASRNALQRLGQPSTAALDGVEHVHDVVQGIGLAGRLVPADAGNARKAHGD